MNRFTKPRFLEGWVVMGGKGHQSSWPFPCQAQSAPKAQVWRLSFVGKMMMNHWFKGTLFPDRPISRFWFLKIHEDVSFMKRTFKRMLFFDSDRFLALKIPRCPTFCGQIRVWPMDRRTDPGQAYWVCSTSCINILRGSHPPNKWCKRMSFLPPMTGNGKHTAYKNGDDWGIVYYCCTNIIHNKGSKKNE